MRIVILTHPDWMASQSMPRYARLLREGLLSRGHDVSCWTCKPSFFSGISFLGGEFKKWQRYADQFLVYPSLLESAVSAEPLETLFVVSDRALGMWIPIIASRPHVVHCHDLLAIRSARGEFPENKTSWTGRIYQELIQEGAATADNYISVSEQTRSDLHRSLGRIPSRSEVLYNPLDPLFTSVGEFGTSTLLGERIPNAEHGGILHVGGNQWYKNRMGVLAIYEAYCSQSSHPLPLWMIGSPPTPALLEKARAIKAPGSVHFFTDFTDKEIHIAYQLASLLLFPSLEEGFGWPIAEAMASGCPVITTEKAPMSEVGADAVRYVARLNAGDDLRSWAMKSAASVFELLSMDPTQKENIKDRGIARAQKFDRTTFLDRLEGIYAEVLG